MRANRMLKNASQRCHSEPFIVIPIPQSRARNLGLPVQGKLREESRSENKGTAGFLVVRQ
jgi:hypothetical protein